MPSATSPTSTRSISTVLWRSVTQREVIWRYGLQRAPASDRACPAPIPKSLSAGVVATAPVSDLAFAAEHAVGGRAVQDLLAAGGEYPDVSPAAMVPLGVPQAIVHGTDDDVVPAAMSAAYSGAAADAGDAVVYHELAGTGHYEVLDPSSEAWGVVAAELERLRGGS